MVNADFMSQLDQGRGGSRFGAWGSAPDPSENGSPVLCRVEHTRRGVIGQGRPPGLVNTATVETQIPDGQPGKLTGCDNAETVLHMSLTQLPAQATQLGLYLYSQILLTTSPRGRGLVPTTAASSSDGCSGLSVIAAPCHLTSNGVRGTGSVAAADRAFSCSAAHSMQPGAHTVLTGGGLRRSSSS